MIQSLKSDIKTHEFTSSGLMIIKYLSTNFVLKLHIYPIRTKYLFDTVF